MAFSTTFSAAISAFPFKSNRIKSFFFLQNCSQAVWLIFFKSLLFSTQQISFNIHLDVCWVGKINASTGIKIIWHIKCCLSSLTVTEIYMWLNTGPIFTHILHHHFSGVLNSANQRTKYNNNTRIQRSDVKSQLFINILNRYHTKWPQCTFLVLNGTWCMRFMLVLLLYIPRHLHEKLS